MRVSLYLTPNLILNKDFVQAIAFYIRNTSLFNNYIKPYSDIFINKGYNIIILHITSLTKDISVGVDLENCLEIDIIKTSITKTIKILKQHNTKAIILINHISIIDVLLVRIANKINIISILMEHGLIISEKEYIKPTNRYKSLKRLIIYLIKYFVFAIISKNFITEIKILYLTQRKHVFKNHFNYYLLYSKYSFNKLKQTFELTDKNTFYSGYPLIKNNKTFEIINKPLKKVLYIHQPHVFHKISSFSYQDEYNYLNKIAEICSSNNLVFTIKLHPLESIEKYKKNLLNIKFAKGNLYKIILENDVILGHYSTALYYAVKMKKPIILIGKNFFKQKFQNNFKIFEQISAQAYNLDKLNDLLTNYKLLYKNIPNYSNFENYYLGENNTYEHRVETLIKILDS